MSQRVLYAIAAYLCEGRPCPHHEKEAAKLGEVIKEAQKLEREEEAQRALDRIVAAKLKEGTHSA